MGIDSPPREVKSVILMKKILLLPLLLTSFPARPQDPPEPAVPPGIQSFSPASGPAGTAVTVLGPGLREATEVSLGGAQATFRIIHVEDRAAILLTVPSAATSGPILVRTPLGSATSAFAFTVTGTAAAPAITSFAPAQGPVGTVVSITGTGFTSGASVAFNGTDAGEATFVSDTQLSATVPAGATTGPIFVTTPGGTATSAAAFTVQTPAARPAVNGFLPLAGPVGTSVAIVGTGFTAGATVAFGGSAAASVTFVAATQLNAMVPAGAASGPITVTTAAGSATSAASFTVTGAPIALDRETGSIRPYTVREITCRLPFLAVPGRALYF